MLHELLLQTFGGSGTPEIPPKILYCMALKSTS